MDKKVLWFLIISGILLVIGLVWVFIDVVGDEKSANTEKKGATISWLINNTPKDALTCPGMKGKVDLGSVVWWDNKANAENVLRQVENDIMPPAGHRVGWDKIKPQYIMMVKRLVTYL